MSLPSSEVVDMVAVDETVNVPAPSSLPKYRKDVRDMMEGAERWDRNHEGVANGEELSTHSRQDTGTGSTWLQRYFGPARKLFSFRCGRRDWDVEAAVTSDSGPMNDAVLEPTGPSRKRSHRTKGRDKSLNVHEPESYHVTAEPNRQPAICLGPAALPIRSDPCPHLLSDKENEKMNRKIDKLVAAIDDHRPIHFAPDATNGEVEIFADHEVIEQDEEEELERSITASPANFGRIIGFDRGIGRIRSANSLRNAESTDSWVSTDSKKSSSNAWERGIAAANVRFALANGGVDHVEIPVRHPFRSSPMVETRRGKRLVRTISPIALDFHKPSRTSTPSIHSNDSEQDTSSPLFGKSCDRILRDTYAQPPESKFRREFMENSQLDGPDFFSGPREAPSPEAREREASSNSGRAFGVFHDDSKDDILSKGTRNSALRLKALKDISNLRRPGYLKQNSFAKDTKPADDRTDTTHPVTHSSVGFGGATNLRSRRAYISRRWPELLDDRGNGNMAKVSRLDGAARRRNEQAIGRAIDTSLYAVAHTRTPVADFQRGIDPTRQAHFDLALARLEGRALPPPPSPIHRHPDWAALYDCDVEVEGDHRPLALQGPAPSKTAESISRRGWWRYFR